jgi:tripartite-type tricarboxylate transporter receptor subunit TctC
VLRNLSRGSDIRQEAAKDIDLVVPFAPGGAVDVTSRLIAEAAKGYLGGVEIKVSNQAGGGGIVGQAYVAAAEPDGYTLLAMTSSVVTNPLLKDVPFAIEDFTPVAAYNLDPEVIAVPASSRFGTIKDFVAASREAPLNMTIAGGRLSLRADGETRPIGRR